MRKLIRRIKREQLFGCLFSLLYPLRQFPTPIVRKRELLDLIGKLHPIFPGKALIRLGGEGDGGYLVPDDLGGIEACFSPGVCHQSSFELDCAKLGMSIFMADKSVDRPAESHENFHFVQKYVAAFTSDDFISLDGWVNHHCGGDSELLLQMDIEGAEYEAILSASESLMKRFRILVIEFHSLEQLWSMPFFNLASRAFDKILQTHSCVHLHPNNCCGMVSKGNIAIPRVMEFTFIRKDRVKNPSHVTEYPHALDRDNTKRPALILPRCWYRSDA